MKMHKLLWGLLVLGAGILLLLNSFGLGEEYDIFRILGSIILLGVSIASLSKFRFVLFFIPLALIVYLWRAFLGINELNVALLLVSAALLGIGLSILFRQKGQRVFGHKQHGDWEKSVENLNDNEYVTIESNLGEHLKYVHANNLKKVKINSSFSSTKVYFDQCQISGEGLEINVSGSFCEIVLSLPKEWSVDNQINVFAGAVTDQSQKTGANANVKLLGSLNFGEIKILSI